MQKETIINRLSDANHASWNPPEREKGTEDISTSIGTQTRPSVPSDFSYLSADLVIFTNRPEQQAN